MSSVLEVSRPKISPSTTVTLPASKSIANRALIIRAISGENFPIGNLPDSDDCIALQKGISQLESIDVGHAGTAMRFLTAYHAFSGREVMISGSSRMQNRPIAPLVNALNAIGAKISYIAQEGFPPLKIEPALPATSHPEVLITGSISSQFISALCMIAPLFAEGMIIRIQGTLISKPYVEMTLRLMRHFGVESEITKTTIRIWPGSYKPDSLIVEPDWSAASYWYSIASLMPDSYIRLPDLSINSLQGDHKIAKYMHQLGVSSTETDTGIELRSYITAPGKLHFNLINEPDLAQTLIVLCAAKDIDASFEGLQSLRHKETDRIEALKTELLKFGKNLIEKDGRIHLSGKFRPSPSALIHTYNDHRMAMSFAPLACKAGKIRIKSPEVVNKSYPGFWADLGSAGFGIQKTPAN